MKRTLVCLTLWLVLFSMFLTGCSVLPNDETVILTKEELTEAMAADIAEKTAVTDYFVAWGFPDFYSATIAPYETSYIERLPDEVSVLNLARRAGAIFLENEYDEVDLTVKNEATSALLRSLTAAANELIPPSAAETIREAMDAEPTATRDSVSLYLVDWGFPGFRTEKMETIEWIFDHYFFEDLPDALTMGRATGGYFLDNLMENTDLSDTEAVTDALIRSYVLSVGDPYSVYRDASEYVEFETDRSGSYVGIGVTVQYKYESGTMEVIAVNDSGPAKTAGIHVGDYLDTVDGQSIYDLGYDATINAIRGEIGTEVTVTVKRGDSYLDFTMIRAALTEQTVTYHVDEDNIGYVRITEFKTNTFDQFKAAIDALEQAGAVGVIYDLRSNPGGALTAVVDCIDYLVPKGTAIASFNGYMDPMYAENTHTFNSVPVVVLCNGYTASAGELFTSAMRDYATENFGLMDATIVGTLTYKKGIMQSTLEMRDGSSLTLTVARYNPPSGVNYHGVGITPDEVLELSETEDNQLARAYEILREKTKSEK